MVIKFRLALQIYVIINFYAQFNQRRVGSSKVQQSFAASVHCERRTESNRCRGLRERCNGYYEIPQHNAFYHQSTGRMLDGLSSKFWLCRWVSADLRPLKTYWIVTNLTNHIQQIQQTFYIERPTQDNEKEKEWLSGNVVRMKKNSRQV